MRRCITCLYPDTKPDLHFDENGECSACRSTKKRKEINWEAREVELEKILDQHHGDCLVASSGGKDSTWIALKLLGLGANVTCVTATTCQLTPIGRKNIDNLARFAKTVEITPNKTIRAKLNKLGLQLVGDISWPEHVAIFTTPFRVAVDMGINLMFYGECPQEAYGGPQGSENARRMTERWRSEFGGFLGLRPTDLIGQGIQERDMQDYLLPSSQNMKALEAYWLGQFYPWNSRLNATVAHDNGMQWQLPSPANIWPFENLDNAQTGLHDFMMFIKYGYGRGCAQVNVDIRNGMMSRQEGATWVKRHDGLFPDIYMGVTIEEILDHIGMEREELDDLISQFTNLDIFASGSRHKDYPCPPGTW
jgi:N-acetyl sugar amidotransferase